MIFAVGILGIILVFAGVAFLMEGEGFGVFLAACGIGMIVLTFILASEAHYAQHQHALKDLRADGWKIQSNDIHIREMTVDVYCVSIDLLHSAGHYYITKDRPGIGGGKFVVSPKSQVKIKEACKAIEGIK